MLTIGEEIKQSKFKSEYQKALLNILLTANTLYASNNRFLKSYGLSPEQYNVLRILRGQFPEPSSVLNIQERMLDKMSNASRLVDKLEVKKLLTRKQCAADRRQVEVTITEEGIKLLQAIDEPFQELENKLSCISAEELDNFNDILDKIRHVYREHVKS